MEVKEVRQAVGILLPVFRLVHGGAPLTFPTFHRCQWCISVAVGVGSSISRMISGRPFCWLPGPLTLKSEAIGVGNKPDTVPSVRGTDGTSRNKQRLDGISFTFKITADVSTTYSSRLRYTG